MKTFKEYFKLNESNLKCFNCGKTFSVPDWLDTPIKCPACRLDVPNPNQEKTGADNPSFWTGHDGPRDFFGKL
jgi:hypothetical protein